MPVQEEKEEGMEGMGSHGKDMGMGMVPGVNSTTTKSRETTRFFCFEPLHAELHNGKT